MGYAVKIVDQNNNELPSVYSEKHKAVFVVANPGTPFQIRVELDHSAEKNVKADIRVDGREIGFKPWLNDSQELVTGFRKDDDKIYRFEFSEMKVPVSIREEDEDEKEHEEEPLDPHGPGAIQVIFYKFHRGVRYCGRPECQRFLQRDRYSPYGGGGGGGRRFRNPLERGRFELRDDRDDDDEQRRKWWQRQNIAAKPGQEISDPRARQRQRSRAPSRSMSRHNANDGYGSMSSYGPRRGGYGRADTGPPPRCSHMRYQKGEQLGEFVAYYNTVDVLLLRGVLDPDEHADHRKILEDCGYYRREKQKTSNRRKRKALERARKKANYEPKVEPGIVVNLADGDALQDISDVHMSDDKEVKAENKVFVRTTKGKEVCDLTRNENMEVWMLQPKQKKTQIIPLE